MKRKVLALLLGSSLVAAALTGCSGGNKETEKATEAKTEAKTEVQTEVQTEAVTEAVAETVETEAVTEAAETEAPETEAVTEAAETEALETEAVTEAAETEAAETEAPETEAVTEAAETEAPETEAVTEAAETEAPETEAVTEAAETEAPETEAVTEAGETEVPETEAVTEAVEETEEAVTEAGEEAVTEAAEEAVTEAAEEAVTVAAEEAVTEAAAAEETGITEGDSFKVGIVQFMDHASLNQIENSLTDRLDEIAEETGAEINYQDYSYNGEGDGTTLNQIASQLIDDGVDVIVAIATPAAQIVQAVDEDKEIPLVFSAVTDPAGAGLVESNEIPGGFVTGTSDALNTETMMKLILANDPDCQKVGLLYSNSEDSSKVPVAEAKAFLEEQGIEVIEKTGTTTDEVSQAVDSLLADKVDAIFTPTDNTVMSAELSIYEKLAEAGVPHYCGADSFALNGAFLGFGVNYQDLGSATADMVADILGGADPAELSVVTFDSGIATINTETAEEIGYDLDEVKAAFEPFCSAIVETTTAENFE